MKNQKLYFFLLLVAITIVSTYMIINNILERKNQIPYELSCGIDSINVIQQKHLEETFLSVFNEVLEKGLRPADLVVLKDLKKVIEKFAGPLYYLNHFQEVAKNNILNEKPYAVSLDSIKELQKSYAELKIFADSADLNNDLKINPKNIDLSHTLHSHELFYSCLVAVEAELLEIKSHLVEQRARKVGSKDISFSKIPEFNFLNKIDSVYNMFYDESYNQIYENPYMNVSVHPLSTFSVDVDVASYSNVRRYINMDILPPPDAVRIEELINYFDFNYPQPIDPAPVAITTEYATCPWNSKHQMLMIGLKAKDLLQNIKFEELPPNNLVFLIDVSGSMDSENKLPLLKNSFKILVNKLRSEDKVSIVVYAGAAGLILPSTSGDQKEKILLSIEKLSAGGSTAGGEGIRLAYKIAQENYIKKGNNRVILATDGDFNVGASSDSDMLSLIKKHRNEGIFITCLGFGMGNFKDSKMETIADNGDGNYAYIDSQSEADNVLGTGFTGTLYTVAKDVKLQIEFNPGQIQGYRLIGYENRILLHEDFINDLVDAGDMGSGHTVTALYEIIPTGIKSEELKNVDSLKYQTISKNIHTETNEIATVKFRYKDIYSKKSKEVISIVNNEINTKPGSNFKISTSVAEYGLLLRRSNHKENADYNKLIERIKSVEDYDKNDKLKEFIELSAKAKTLKPVL